MAMKNLKDVLEKLKVDDIMLPGENFPIDGTFDEMIEWLKYNDFVEDSNISRNFRKLVQTYNAMHKKIFLVCDLDNRMQIRIANTIKATISASNPVISINFYEKFIEYMISWPTGFDIINQEECNDWIKKILKR